MALSHDLVSKFVKATKNTGTEKNEATAYGVVVENGTKIYIKLDGSNVMTPASSTVSVNVGDRVTVLLKNHTANITGNISSPASRGETVDKAVNDISNLKTLVSDKASIKDLEAERANIKELIAENATIKGHLNATDASIKNLEAEKLSAKDADIKYANIDFANIGEAAIKKLFSDTGLIKNLIVGNGTITGELVGVTIKGDLIEGNTIVADKLVVKGSDGLYYKLNTDGMSVEAQQTDYNSLNGQVIRAKSITATKIAVNDLVAFDATIAGLNMTNGSLYSGAKNSVNNSTRGFYLDNTGQMALGDMNNHLKYFKDQNGEWKLVLTASSIKLGSSGKDIEETLSTTIASSEEEFYQSSSATALIGGSWAKVQPVWADGKYIWRRNVVTYGNGTVKYTPSETGVCISGNTGPQGNAGAQGPQGVKGEDAVLLHIASSNGQLFKNSAISTNLTVTIITAGISITSARQMHNQFGPDAYLEWEQKRFGETVFTKIDRNDVRLNDEGFILSISAQDILTQTVFNCNLIY